MACGRWEIQMTLGSGCYCGKVRYEAAGTPMLRAQCHCRPCQYFSGGAANMFMLMPVDGFRYTKGAPRQFKRDDLERAVTREFCSDCGTQLITRRPRPQRHHPQGRNPRRSDPIRRVPDGDQRQRQAGVQLHPRRVTDLRGFAAALMRAAIIRPPACRTGERAKPPAIRTPAIREI